MAGTPEIEWLDAPVVDAEIAAPAGRPCEACGTPVEALDKFCPACGTANPEYRPAAAGPDESAGGIEGTAPARAARGASGRHAAAGPADDAAEEAELVEAAPVDGGPVEGGLVGKHFQCRQCGAEVATDPGQRSYVCPFCDSTYVVELAPSITGRQAPEFVIGFAITPDQAHEAFRKWLRSNDWFRPGDLAAASVADKLKGVYLPFWSFTMLAQSGWTAQIGEYWYRTETYTTRDSKGNLVTRTRQVRETEWWPLSGNHHRYYSGYLVSGSKGLPQSESLRIQPFQLPSLKRYEPYFLAGWLAEEYSVARDEALAMCRAEFERQELRNVAGFLPGDTHSGLAVDTRFSQVSSDLCLLPIYILSYRYQDRVYRFLLNGQTGKLAGDKPVSGQRIGLAVAAAVALVLLLVFIAWLMSR